MPPGRPSCVGNSTFDPDQFFTKWAAGEFSPPSTDTHDLRTSIIHAFGLPPSDSYVYRAVASVTLHHVQQAISAGAQHGLHAWYPVPSTQQLSPSPPPPTDIEAYTSIFSSTTSTDKALKAFASNAKKDSIRARVAQNLLDKRTFPSTVPVPKLKQPQTNPYLDFWAWSCRCLEWCGPEEATKDVKQSHHILPVFYHHFGCVVPSYEALETLKQLAGGRPIIDAGSGNGYWTYMLRCLGLQVTPVDDGTSAWRTMWVGDTVKMDAARYIQKQRQGAEDAVLLMVYPQVTMGFTRDTIKAYKGDTICVAGTQNENAFTADVEGVLGEEWERVVKTPLPSFAGKDEAFWVWKWAG